MNDDLTLEQKASLGSGATFWTTKAVGSVPGIFLTDGPHGVRKQVGSADALGLNASIPATCFPPASGLSRSWDPELVRRVGEALAEEAQAADVQVLLGPGVNIKRDPRCGRNFEYFSEDPLISGVLGAAIVRGLQNGGVAASPKHFAANNAEDDRFRASSDIDARTLREIYLKSFQRVVQDGEPWTLMAAYNKVNGVHAAENRWLLTDVLRGEWGFEGVVVSDWAAVTDRVAAVAAGLDLEMPSTDGRSDSELVAAVQDGIVGEDTLDLMAERVIRLAERVGGARRPDTVVDDEAHHALARQAAAASLVLLKNDGGILPLEAPERIAVIGPFGAELRIQGGGSSHVTPTRVDVPMDEIRRAAPQAAVEFATGFSMDEGPDPVGERRDAVDIAARSDVAIVFLGLSERDESEGYDRDTIDLPARQLQLLAEVVAVQPRTVVVLTHGGVVRLREVSALAPAILDGALLGQGGASAIADVLFGMTNPSGRLTETVPERIEDTPAYLSFVSESGHLHYGERIFVGYRWYDARDMPVTFPFGHGLSYTTFEYSRLRVSEVEEGVRLHVAITNAGDRAGREVVQFYVGLAESAVARAPRSLVQFAVTDLQPGETRWVEVLVRREDVAFWDVRVDAWVVEAGRYVFSAGASSRDIRLAVEVDLAARGPSVPFTLDSTIGELLSDPVGAVVLEQRMGDASAMLGEDAAGDPGTSRMLAALPLGRLAAFAAGRVTREQLGQLVDVVNSTKAVSNRTDESVPRGE